MKREHDPRLIAEKTLFLKDFFTYMSLFFTYVFQEDIVFVLIIQIYT